MDFDSTIRRAQVYAFFSHTFLYPSDNWTADLPQAKKTLDALYCTPDSTALQRLELTELQASYRRTFGAGGSLCYETEYGLPNEYRQSQELADIAGFYRAFGFVTGGPARERPDHLAVELEFMYVMALKEAYAAQNTMAEQREICRVGQQKFLVDHLGKWIQHFARSIEAQGHPPYVQIACLTAAFVQADAACLGVALKPLQLADLRPTPFDPDFSCAGCGCASTSILAQG